MTNSSFKESKYQVARFFFAFLFLCLLCSSPRGHHLRMKAEPQKLPDEREIDTSQTFFFLHKNTISADKPSNKSRKKSYSHQRFGMLRGDKDIRQLTHPFTTTRNWKKKKDSNENVCRGSRSRYNALTEKKKKSATEGCAANKTRDYAASNARSFSVTSIR